MYLPQYLITTNIRSIVVTATNKFRAEAKVSLSDNEKIISIVKKN